MRESFMKYDRDNPPAGVNENGVFTGGGVYTIEVEMDMNTGKYNTVDMMMLTEALNSGKEVIVLFNAKIHRLMLADYSAGDGFYTSAYFTNTVVLSNNQISVSGIKLGYTGDVTKCGVTLNA